MLRRVVRQGKGCGGVLGLFLPRLVLLPPFAAGLPEAVSVRLQHSGRFLGSGNWYVVCDLVATLGRERRRHWTCLAFVRRTVGRLFAQPISF